MKTISTKLSDHLETMKNQAWLRVGSAEHTRIAVSAFPGRAPEIVIWTHSDKPIHVRVYVYGTDTKDADREGII